MMQNLTEKYLFKTYGFEDLTPEQMNLLPTEAEVETFHSIGWHKTPVILPDELIAKAVKAAYEVQNGVRDWTLKDYSRINDDDISTGKRAMNNEMVALQKKEFAKLFNYPVIGATAAKLARTNSIRAFGDSLFSKKPRVITDPGIIGWHTDRAYWPTCTSHNMLTVWIPLQDCTIDMGPVVYIDGSHKWKDDVRFREYYNANAQSLEEMNAFLNKEKPNHTRTAMTLKKGQVSFHHGYTIHASSPNTSSKERIAFAAHLQDDANDYQKQYRPDGSILSIGYDTICRKDENGLPDYSDPDVFPTLFRVK
jgi:ectoine hydroxylase-related dioxygenase (phytanoyl-CoA dioxygenase family)